MHHLLLAAVAALAPSGMPNPYPLGINVYARVDVDAQGAIQSLRFREGTGERLQALLRDRIKSWRFEPATADGRPAATQTTITVELRPGADGQSLDIASVSAGVAPLRVVAPKYLPPVGTKIHRGAVVLRCKVLADGRCSEITVEHSTASKLLETNSITALRRWRFETEVVSGVAVEPWMLFPFCFATDRRSAAQPECAASQERAVAGSEPSRAKLKDPLAQQ